jgi:hypothetical protein
MRGAHPSLACAGQRGLTDALQKRQQIRRQCRFKSIMNNSTLEIPLADRSTSSARVSRPLVNPEELSQLKRELLQAEVRLAKARATVAGTEVDIKVLNSRTKAFTK